MSYLENPSFESIDEGWAPLNLPGSVQYGTLFDPAVAKSGNAVYYFRTSTPDGSVAQDVTVLAPSVSCFAWLRAETGVAEGALTIWRLNTGHETSARFQVGQQWTLVTNVMGLRVGGVVTQQALRVEFYLSTVNVNLFIDSTNLF
jgi:hypothetical protein